MHVDEADPGPPEFRPRRVTPASWRRSAAAVVGLGLTILIVAILARIFAPEPIRLALATPAEITQASPIAAGDRPLPPAVACHYLELAACRQIIGAALAGLPSDAPEASAASAWASLLCDSSIDCPPAQLSVAIPRGSVVISFADRGPDAWLNVVDHPAAPGQPPETEAWIVRWAPTALIAAPTSGRGPGSPH